jgi:hypothetical protein
LFKPLEAKITTVQEVIDMEHMCWSEEKLEVNFIATDRFDALEFLWGGLMRMNGLGRKNAP